jgi:hypothetical protein
MNKYYIEFSLSFESAGMWKSPEDMLTEAAALVRLYNYRRQSYFCVSEG